MRRADVWAVWTGIVVAGCVAAWAQAPAPAAAAQTPASQVQQLQAATGGTLHGVVKSGGTPLPGVTVTAQNTLTGKRFSATTEITGAWSLKIPQNGRYVIRTQFAGFAPGSQEAVLNAASHDQTVNFELMLASRAADQQQQQARQESEEGPEAQAIRQLAASGAQNLGLVRSDGDVRVQAGFAGGGATAAAGAAGIRGRSAGASHSPACSQRRAEPGPGERAGSRYGDPGRPIQIGRASCRE